MGCDGREITTWTCSPTAPYDDPSVHAPEATLGGRNEVYQSEETRRETDCVELRTSRFKG
jgi:hypothetical protein